MPFTGKAWRKSTRDKTGKRQSRPGLRLQGGSNRQFNPDRYRPSGERALNSVKTDDMARMIDAHMLGPRPLHDPRHMPSQFKPLIIATATGLRTSHENARINARRPDRQYMGAGVPRILRESATPNAQ